MGQFDEAEWQDALASHKIATIPSRQKLVQLKIIHRTYYTRVLLHRIGKIGTPLCLRECGQSGTYFHTIWECPRIQPYWESILNIVTQVTGVTLKPNAKRCLLNIWEPTDLNQAMRKWVTLGLMQARRNIAQHWGAVLPPTRLQWCKDMDNNMITERTVYQHRGCPQKWKKVWGRWNNYRGCICTPPRSVEHTTTDSDDTNNG